MIRWFLSLLPPSVPKRFTVVDAHYFLDGGTTVLEGIDEKGRKRSITLTQQMLPRESRFEPPIGRLYVGGRLVPLHSEAEAAVLAVLEAAFSELQSRSEDPPQVPAVEEPGAAPAGQAIFFGTSDLAALAQIRGDRERMAWMVRRVVEYVRSKESGKLLGGKPEDAPEEGG